MWENWIKLRTVFLANYHVCYLKNSAIFIIVNKYHLNFLWIFDFSKKLPIDITKGTRFPVQVAEEPRRSRRIWIFLKFCDDL